VATAIADSPVLIPRQVLADWAVLSVDVESNPADGDRIFKFGAARSDIDVAVNLSTNRLSGSDLARQTGDVAQGARLLVGHNIRRHDLPQLRRQYPGLKFLDLPLLDTLELSAIAFPTNPYHRLIKGYKLLSDSRNDPLKDARLALDLLADEVEALVAMQQSDPVWVSTGDSGPPCGTPMTPGSRCPSTQAPTFRNAAIKRSSA
jgi:ATP-dependent DNA helicase RecQ